MLRLESPLSTPCRHPASPIKSNNPATLSRVIAVKTHKKRIDFMVRLNFCFNRAEDKKPKRLV